MARNRLVGTQYKDLWPLHAEAEAALVRTCEVLNQKWNHYEFQIVNLQTGMVNLEELSEACAFVAFILGIGYIVDLYSCREGRYRMSYMHRARELLDEYPAYCFELALQYFLEIGFLKEQSRQSDARRN